MASSPLAGLRPQVTHHCVTGSMRNVYLFHGVDISEEMLLGLGAGVGFIYWQMKGIPPLLGGRANVGRPGEKGLEKTAGERTGVVVESFTTSSRRKAQDALLAQLNSGEPVMMNVDMGYLPYFRLPEGYHFGGHVIVVVGYDPGNHSVLVADRDGLLHPVSLEKLADARGSTFKPFPPMNLCFSFDFANARPPRADEIRQALCEETRTMLEAPIANLGVRGIQTAAERVLQWPKSMTEAELRTACWTSQIYIDATGGTGGGIFRYMYSRFLDEAAALIDEPHLLEVSRALHAVGDEWQEVAGLLSAAAAAPDPVPLLRESSARLSGIADKETRAWSRLREVVG